MLKHVPLGKSKILISCLGLGCMGMSDFYGASDKTQNMQTLERALALGVNFFDTADMYGTGANEELLGEFMNNRRQDIVLATKFGIVRDKENPMARGISGKPHYVKAACEASLKRLNTDYVDLYYAHRIDPTTPIEDTVGAMAELVQQGKVRTIGLSEVSVKNLRRAHAVHPISAVQTEYSVFTRDAEAAGVTQACAELGITFVAYSPLGRGILTGSLTSLDSIAADDYRRSNPRYMAENLSHNNEIVARFAQFAQNKGVTSAQLALAWLLAQNTVPIPGTRHIARLEENIAANSADLSDADWKELESLISTMRFAGERYNPVGMASLDTHVN